MTADSPAPTVADRKARKKKAKVRSAWISFGGRIVAQIVGAMASVILGVMVVTNYKLTERRALREGHSVRCGGRTPCAAPRRTPVG